MTTKELFDQYGAIHVKDVISRDMCDFLTHILLRAPYVGYGKLNGDPQVPTAKSVIDHEIVFETLLERTWPKLEAVLGFEVLPTYAYARLYSNGDDLKPHMDRPACEISVTVQLGRSHHYAWPIYMADKRYDMAEGDGVIYKGCDVQHWRNVCEGPDGYYSGQAFLHFVDKNGPNASEFADATHRTLKEGAFVKNRTFLMSHK